MRSEEQVATAAVPDPTGSPDGGGLPRAASHAAMLRQFLTFGIIGGSGVLVNMAVVILCNRSGPDATGIVWPIVFTPWSVRWYHVYSTLAFLVANVSNFFLNRRLTFSDSRHMTVRSQFWPFFCVGAIGQLFVLGINTLLLNPTSPLFLDFAWMDSATGLRKPEYWAQLTSLVVVTPLSFILNKVWSFASHRAHRCPKNPTDS
ncbi:GtrA-like protein [Dermatophilus congolensis]|uniref:GtrA-like protein n=2 Tax=Dermatophilus congolensis TaxID=1863 RepID=A0A239V340_9MICO|nr:GtrA-like protein [Dermatophilus congolensis]